MRRRGCRSHDGRNGGVVRRSGGTSPPVEHAPGRAAPTGLSARMHCLVAATVPTDLRPRTATGICATASSGAAAINRRGRRAIELPSRLAAAQSAHSPQFFHTRPNVRRSASGLSVTTRRFFARPTTLPPAQPLALPPARSPVRPPASLPYPPS